MEVYIWLEYIRGGTGEGKGYTWIRRNRRTLPPGGVKNDPDDPNFFLHFWHALVILGVCRIPLFQNCRSKNSKMAAENGHFGLKINVLGHGRGECDGLL